MSPTINVMNIKYVSALVEALIWRHRVSWQWAAVMDMHTSERGSGAMRHPELYCRIMRGLNQKMQGCSRTGYKHS